jgi:hypothetical protein
MFRPHNWLFGAYVVLVLFSNVLLFEPRYLTQRFTSAAFMKLIRTAVRKNVVFFIEKRKKVVLSPELNI